MKATELRLGNIVAAIDDPEKPDVVMLLEPGVVQLMSRPEADDENNIVGVPITPQALTGFQVDIEDLVDPGGRPLRFQPGDVEGTLRLAYGDEIHILRHMHELQNLVFSLSGRELFMHPYLHFIGESV